MRSCPMRAGGDAMLVAATLAAALRRAALVAGRRPVRFLRRHAAAATAAARGAQQASSSPIPSPGSRRPPLRQYVPPTRAAAAGSSGSPVPYARVAATGEVFSADARPRPRRPQMCPGVLSCQRDQGLFRLVDRRCGVANRRSVTPTARTPSPTAGTAFDCTCNGREPAGLAPVDLALDSSLKAGDVIATSDGLVAYTGVRVGNDQAADFTPVASYPGLTAQVRARLGEMKVAPVRAETVVGRCDPPRRSCVRRCRCDGAEDRQKPAKRAGLD